MDDDAIDRLALGRLLAVIGGDADELRDLIDDFAESAPGQVADMVAAADARDLEALRRCAHTLKSNARDFGATRLAALCADLEQALRNGSPSDPAAETATIATACRLALDALSRIDPRKLAG